jgi:GNAT superfamily N-acetyltransferase
MPWHLTGDISDFVAAADDYLRGDPVRNTVPLSVLAGLLASGPAAYGDDPPQFGWHESGGRTDGAMLRTPPHPLLVAGLPAGSAAGLLSELAAARPDAANMLDQNAAEFSAAWAGVTGGRTEVHHQMALFRLAGLRPPTPAQAGTARAPGDGELDLLAGWTGAFGTETGATVGDPARAVSEWLSYGGMLVWDDNGPAAMACLSRTVAGVCRVGTVYTPPDRRQHGYGGAITTAISQQALDAGATEIVLYTDLANPTSNALYERLGYRRAGGRVTLALLP